MRKWPDAYKTKNGTHGVEMRIGTPVGEKHTVTTAVSLSRMARWIKKAYTMGHRDHRHQEESQGQDSALKSRRE